MPISATICEPSCFRGRRLASLRERHFAACLPLNQISTWALGASVAGIQARWSISTPLQRAEYLLGHLEIDNMPSVRLGYDKLPDLSRRK